MDNILKNNFLKNYILIILGTILFLGVLSLVLAIFLKIEIISSFRIIFGTFYVIFLPGFFITYIFFPLTSKFNKSDKPTKSIDWIERIALSFALSISIIPIITYFLSTMGLKISTLSSIIMIISIIIASLIIILIKKYFGKSIHNSFKNLFKK